MTAQDLSLVGPQWICAILGFSGASPMACFSSFYRFSVYVLALHSELETLANANAIISLIISLIVAFQIRYKIGKNCAIDNRHMITMSDSLLSSPSSSSCGLGLKIEVSPLKPPETNKCILGLSHQIDEDANIVCI